MRFKKSAIFAAGVLVIASMLACNLTIPGIPGVPEAGGTETNTPAGSGITATVTPGLSLPPVVTTSLKVVYSKAGNVWIWTEGGSPQQLTFGGGASNPKLSPDGATVAFNRNGELWVVNTDGSGEHVLVDHAFILAYAVTPGDDVLVDDIVWRNPEFIAFNTLEVSQGAGYQVPLFDYKLAYLASGASETSSPGEGGVPYYSPDGNTLALAQSDKVIFRYSTPTIPWTVVLNFPMVLTYSEWMYVPELVWLPDSSAVRLVVPAHDPLLEPSQVSSFWNIPVSGEPTRLTTFLSVPAFFNAPFVSPDGQKVVYLVDNGPNTEIHVITADGVDARMLSFPVNSVGLLGWNPDSNRFVFSQPDPQHVQLGSAGSAQPLGDTPLVQNIRWINTDQFLFKNGEELRILALGGLSNLIDSGVSDFDFVLVTE